MNVLIQNIRPFSIALLGVLMIMSCGKDDPDVGSSTISIEDYITQNNLSPEYTTTGIGYIIGNEGTADRSTDISTVKTEVVVTSTKDVILIDTEGEIYLNMLAQVPALQEGMQLIGEGGKIVMYAPYESAWGVAGNVSIPAESDVIIEISLTSILIDVEDYLTRNSLEGSTIEGSNVLFIVDEEGDGDFPDEDDVVTVKYTGYLSNGDIFDESTEGLSISLQNVISGWTDGIPQFSRGGKGSLYIPYESAYGTGGTAGIPGYTDLIFDIELIDF